MTVLPPALRSLVLLWEELSKGCLRSIQRQEIMSSPMTASVVLRRPESSIKVVAMPQPSSSNNSGNSEDETKSNVGSMLIEAV